MRILVTGAAGYVGKAAIEVLRREHDLRLFDAMPVPDEPEATVADIADFASVTAALEGMDAVVNLAITSGPGAYDTPELPMRVNAQGIANILEAARRAGIRRIVHMSSGAVVTGYPRDTFIHVELPFNYRGMYCLSKAMQEHLCKQYAWEFSLDIVALRPWDVCDSRTMTAKNGKPLQYDARFFGLVCRYDLAEACNAALRANIQGFQPFHIMATDEGERWFDMQRTHEVLGWRPQETFARLKAAPSAG